MASGMRLGSKPMALTGISPMKMCPFFRIQNLKTSTQHIFVKATKLGKVYENHGLVVLKSSMGGSDELNLISVSDTIERFYDGINKKQSNQLQEFFSDDCSLEDYSFPYTFKGKKEVIGFFSQLIASMGPGVEFKIGNICIGDDFAAGLTWHLEWNKIMIPFTRGCSFFQCSNEISGLLIKKCLTVTESPMKPGGSALILLKTVIILFDKFPKAAERFLKSPQELLQIIIKIYSVFFRPFLIPILTWYTKIGKLIGRLLSYILCILIFISKIFYK